MKNIILLLFLSPIFLYAEEDLKRIVQIQQVKSKVLESLPADVCIYNFTFIPSNNYLSQPASVQYSMDGKNGEQKLKHNSITIESTPGKHIFQFYYSDNYYEVYSDSIEIASKHYDTYHVQLYQAEIRQMEEKPVIYLYPESSTEVSVKMDIKGENPFYYPSYNDSWKFTAQPNGDLIFGKNTYNYLFWEASNKRILSPEQTASGFFVEGTSAVKFLEEKLTLAGLNSKEQADFITYWGPRLAQNKLNFVHFEFNKTCEKYANIDISPQPDNIYRIYMAWGPASEQFNVVDQEIERINRSGFTVLEWGGQESQITQSFLNQSMR